MRPRELVILQGDPDQTAAKARTLVAELPAHDVLWISSAADVPGAIAPRQAVRQLGRSFDAVVLNLHAGLDPDLLAQAQGFVWGGGALVLRLPDDRVPPLAQQERLSVFPFGPHEVGGRLWQRLLDRVPPSGPPTPLAPGDRPTGGSDEQQALVGRLAERWRQQPPSVTVLMADRGRGKSSALGLAVAALARQNTRCRVSATGPSLNAVKQVLDFAGPGVDYVDPGALLSAAAGGAQRDVLIVDEAAQLSVPLLRALVEGGHARHLVFATTVHGYEGTGRGFALRFVGWLRARAPRPYEDTLKAPIRWGEGDPLEAWTFELLALDAEPGPAPQPRPPSPVEHEVLSGEALARDEALLRQVFGLLVQAHYRTTPADLHRLLDAPNLSVEVLREGNVVLAATLLAREGALPPALCRAVARGEQRLRGHALADMMVAHGGHEEAGALRMLRSVRIATHPDRRREGLACRLVEQVHRHDDVDLFGTLFGATAALLRFRRSVGYRLVRIGAARGTRTGEPAAVMVRPVSDDAKRVVGQMRKALARDLPLQLALHRADPSGALLPELEEALFEGLEAPEPLSDEALLEEVSRTVGGPRPLEATAWALTHFCEQHQAQLAGGEGELKVGGPLVLARFIEVKGWRAIADEAGLSVPAAMRAARRALAQLLESLDER